MPSDVFDATLEVLKELCYRGTQKEVNLNGNGESLLDKHFFERAYRVKQVMGDRSVGFCTNGVNMTPEIADALVALDLNYVDVSPHSPWHARRAVDMLVSAGLTKGQVNFGAILQPHNWAGQLDEDDSVTVRLQLQCDPLIEGRGYVQAEGHITPCCYDYRLLGAFTHVEDKDVLDKPMDRFEICDTCHQVIPEGCV
jgi:hypothetical protein